MASLAADFAATSRSVLPLRTAAIQRRLVVGNEDGRGDAPEAAKRLLDLGTGVETDGAATNLVHDGRDALGVDEFEQVDVRAQEAREADRIARTHRDDVIRLAQGRNRGGIAARCEEVPRDLLVVLEAEPGVQDRDVDPLAARLDRRGHPLGRELGPAVGRRARARREVCLVYVTILRRRYA